MSLPALTIKKAIGKTKILHIPSPATIIGCIYLENKRIISDNVESPALNIKKGIGSINIIHEPTCKILRYVA